MSKKGLGSSFSQKMPSLVEATQIIDVPISYVKVVDNIRSDLGYMGDLVERISREGVKQPVRALKVGRYYYLIFGHRRLEASVQAGKSSIPVIVEELPPDIVVEGVEDIQNSKQVRDYILNLQISENLSREDLNVIDEAIAMREYLELELDKTEEYEDYGSLEELLKALDNDRRRMSENVPGQLRDAVENIFLQFKITWSTFLKDRLPLLEMSDDLKETLRNHDDTFKPAHAREIGKVDEPHLRETLIKKVVDEGMGLRELKERVKEDRKRLSEPLLKELSSRKNETFVGFDDVPGLRVKEEKNGYIFKVNTEKEDLVNTLEGLIVLAREGKLTHASIARVRATKNQDKIKVEHKEDLGSTSTKI